MPIRNAVLIALIAAPAVASAVPTQVSHQGRLFNALGAPLTGTHDLSFEIYDTPSGGTAVWSETHTGVPFDNGYFSITLGTNSALDSDVANGDDLWLSTAIDSGPALAARLPINSVPYALRAQSVSGGVVDASELQIGGTTVIDSSGVFSGSVDYSDVSNAPSTIDDLGCTDGQVAVFSGSSWGCAAADAHTHDASDITGGILDVARIPVGSTNGSVAAGDHAHSSIQLQDNSASCSSSLAGTLRYTSGSLEVCDGTDWTATGGSLGSSVQGAATDCNALHTANPSLPSGYYWIDPDGSGAFQAYCDMQTDGGGWTLCFAYDNARYDSNNWPNVASVRDRVLAGTWGETALYDHGSRQGSFCAKHTVVEDTTELMAEVVRVDNSQILHQATYTLRKDDFFTQTHNGKEFDCLGSVDGSSRLIYANYTDPRNTYQSPMLTACSPGADTHATNVSTDNGPHGVDGALIMSNANSGSNTATDLSLHFNWYANAANETLYASGGQSTQTKFGDAATWYVNGYGRSGQSPGPYFCYTQCGHTNTVQNVFKQRLWIR